MHSMLERARRWQTLNDGRGYSFQPPEQGPREGPDEYLQTLADWMHDIEAADRIAAVYPSRPYHAWVLVICPHCAFQALWDQFETWRPDERGPECKMCGSWATMLRVPRAIVKWRPGMPDAPVTETQAARLIRIGLRHIAEDAGWDDNFFREKRERRQAMIDEDQDLEAEEAREMEREEQERWMEEEERHAEELQRRYDQLMDEDERHAGDR